MLARHTCHHHHHSVTVHARHSKLSQVIEKAFACPASASLLCNHLCLRYVSAILAHVPSHHPCSLARSLHSQPGCHHKFSPLQACICSAAKSCTLRPLRSIANLAHHSLPAPFILHRSPRQAGSQRAARVCVVEQASLPICQRQWHAIALEARAGQSGACARAACTALQGPPSPCFAGSGKRKCGASAMHANLAAAAPLWLATVYFTSTHSDQ